MIDADESFELRDRLSPAALAALGAEGRFRALSERVLSPQRPGLRDARQAVADVLFGLAPERVKRFEARGVMYFDLGSPDVQSSATREVWETVCDRLALSWATDDGRRFLDRPVRTWRSRDGARVSVHRQGSGGAVETRSLHEDDLLDSDDPGALVRALAAGPMLLDCPPTLSAVVSLASAHTAVARAEALAWEAVHGATRGTRPPPMVVWRFEDRTRLLATRASELAVLRRGVDAMERWAERTGAWRRFHPSVPDPFEAVLAIYETGMLLDAITPEWVSLVCPLTA
jgi:hypothetical protein